MSLLLSLGAAKNIQILGDITHEHQPKVTMATTPSQASSNNLPQSETHCLTGEEN